MQANSLPAFAGWQWIRMGWMLFRMQPAPLFTWTMFISLALVVSMLVAPIGPLIFITLVPTITFLTLSACRRIHAGERPLLMQWLTPLKDKVLLGKLLRLGGIYTAISLTAALASFLPFSAELSNALQSAADGNDLEYLSQVLSTPVLIFSILYFVLAALFWYAPVLVGWHNLTISRSLFYSAVACWRNKWSLAVYAIIWAGIFSAVDWLFGVLIAAGIPLEMAAALQVPVNILAACVLYCSFYPTYVTVFQGITPSFVAEDTDSH